MTKSEATDAEIRERYGAVVEAALAGDLQDWATRPRGALALIVLLDQFTRNIYRDTPRAFAGDAQALALARALAARGDDRRLAPPQRWFADLPFEHSESLAPSTNRCACLPRSKPKRPTARWTGRVSTPRRSCAVAAARTATPSSAARRRANGSSS